jgi:hypothetical protein
MAETTVEETATEEIPQEEEVNDDPGQFEGIADEKEEYSKKVKGRIDELTKNWRGTERELEKARSESKSRIEELEKKLAAIESKPVPEPPKEEKPDRLSQLKEEQKALRAERRKARTDMDVEAELNVQDRLDDLALEITAEIQKASISKVKKEVKEVDMQTAAKSFKRTHKWFASSPAEGRTNPDYHIGMSGMAKELEESLYPTWTGTYPELLAEIGKQVEEAFKKPEKPKVAAVAAAGGLKQTSEKVIELTDIQKKTAYKMFPDEPDPLKTYREYM